MKDLIENHWTTTSALYNRWTKDNLQSGAVRRVWLQCLRETLGPAPLRVLDVGTGPGFMSCFLAELGHEVTGVDLSPGMLEQARANAQQLGLKVRFEQGDAERLPFPDGAFDAVITREVLPEIVTPVAVLASLGLGQVVLNASALSFLGLGVSPPEPEWGAMLNSARPYLNAAPRLLLIPGVAISLTVASFHLLAAELRKRVGGYYTIGF